MKILITGASSGIGASFAKIAVTDGHQVILVARREDRLKSIKESLGPKASIFISDLTAEGAIEKLHTAHPDIDILVNNAGFGNYNNFEQADWSTLNNMININITALTHLTKQYLPTLIKNKGKILNVASTASFQPGPTMATYFATKAYVYSFSQGLRAELKGRVSVTTLCPGPTRTEFQQSAKANLTQKFKGNVPTSKQVAQYGYDSLMAGKGEAIYGIKNKIFIFMQRFVPRSLVVKVTGKVISGKD